MMHPTIVAFEEGAQAMRRLRSATVWFTMTVLALLSLKCRSDATAARADAARWRYVTDSTQRVQRAYQYQAEQNELRADRWMQVADSLRPLTEKIPDVITRIVAAAPLPRPSLLGDTIRFEDDTIAHVVDHPVASWVGAANAHITHLEALVRDTIRTAWNTMALENRALRAGFTELQGANLNLDSLATSRLKETNLLRAELARTKPSTVSKLVRYATIGGALYVGYRVGRGR